VFTTLLVGTVLMVVLQSFLYGRIGDGLVAARMELAQYEAASAAQDVRETLQGMTSTDRARIRLDTGDVLARQRRDTGDRTRDIILVRAIDNQSGPASWDRIQVGSLDVTAIPTALRRAVAGDPARQQVQILTVPGSNGQNVPAIVVGSLVTVPQAGPYELYYVFPMEWEEGIMAVVSRVFLVGSIALVATLGLVAFLVTRIVVDPLRQASEVAARLSDGHLNERMLVRGEDDIARLATAFNDMAEHLQAKIQQLEDLSRVQQRFVSDVSHELRTPLTTIHMASELIHDQRAEFDPVVSRTAELLHTQVERFEELLADLLEISRFDAGGAALDLDSVDMRVQVNRAISGIEQLAAARGSEIVVVGDGEAHVAAIDSRRVDRILRNLLVNAVEHGEGRPVVVELGSDEDTVAVVVADQGIGLKPGQADLVFNRFWRGDPSRKRTTGGTGLGLAISLEDAHLHHGWLQAWGEQGRGARFRLTLPRGPGLVVRDSPLPLAAPEAPPAVIASAPVDPVPADPVPADPASDGAGSPATRDSPGGPTRSGGGAALAEDGTS